MLTSNFSVTFITHKYLQPLLKQWGSNFFSYFNDIIEIRHYLERLKTDDKSKEDKRKFQ